MTHKRKVVRARDRGAVRQVNIELDAELAEALGTCAEREERTFRAIVSRALKDYLMERELWPTRKEATA